MNISILEFLVYAIVGYAGLLTLITSITKEMPGGKNSTIVRCIFLIPSIICIGVLTFSGVNITLQSGTVANVIKNLNDTSTWSEAATTTNTIVLVNPIWISVHFMFFIIMIIYVLIQILQLLTTKTSKATE